PAPIYTSSGDHRHLHSFPTRRSSDLKNYFTYDKKPLYLLDENSSKMDYFINTDNSVINLTDLYFSSENSSATVAEGDTVQIKFRDRKSTRLNSSHVKISYAVFCLKKK